MKLQATIVALVALVALSTAAPAIAGPAGPDDATAPRIAIDCAHPRLPPQHEVGALLGQHNIGQVYASRAALMAESPPRLPPPRRAAAPRGVRTRAVPFVGSAPRGRQPAQRLSCAAVHARSGPPSSGADRSPPCQAALHYPERSPP